MKYSLTVLICVHSRSGGYDDLLMKALRSLESQTYKNFKTLIVLDSCWEETEQRINQNNFSLNIIIKSKETKEGLSRAKNFGLSFVDTDLVAFLDADDMYVETKLEKQMNFFNENEVDFLGTQTWVIYGLVDLSDGDVLRESCFALGTNETHDEIQSKIFGENVLTHGSLMIKMESLKELDYYFIGLDGNNNDVRGREDWNLWQRAMIKGYKFHQLQERLYIYRLFSGIDR